MQPKLLARHPRKHATHATRPSMPHTPPTLARMARYFSNSFPSYTNHIKSNIKLDKIKTQDFQAHTNCICEEKSYL